MSEQQWVVLVDLISALVIPILMTVFTVLMYLGRPKHRNAAFGYRTRRSMQSEESWAYAHTVCRKYLLVYSVLLWLGTAGLLIFTEILQAPMGLMLLLLAETLGFLPVIPYTEGKLKKRHF